MKVILPGLDHKLLLFVMARRQESGGFGFAPTLPASLEDTYHAVQILKTMRPVSETAILELKEDQGLKGFVMRGEDKESWSFKSAYRYLWLCAFCGMHPGRDLFKGLKWTDSGRKTSLEDRYYLKRIQREFSGLAPVGCGRPFNGAAMKNWRSAGELRMCLSIYNGFCQPLHTTRKNLIKWLQSCQAPDGGFGAVPRATSFIENTHVCLCALALLGAAPGSLPMAEGFILGCRTRGGGFARKSRGAPFLDATWHAVASLNLLYGMKG